MRYRSAQLGRVSCAVLAIALATPVWAQTQAGAPAGQEPTAAGTVASAQGEPATQDTTAETPQDDIVVTGVRASLAGAQDIKRNATSIVDSIVAEDIGKLPDNTVSDALQRVTGVQVTRAAGEATSVQLRGLPDITTYINGRETFTGTGRGVALADIPAELVAGLDVYKTLTPELIEGAIAGAIDIRLRRPLDFDGLKVAGGLRGIYGDQVDKWSYVGSGLVSNKWTTAGGQEFGVLIAGGYNRRRYQDHTAFNFGFACPQANCVASPTNANAGQTLLIPDTVGGIATQGDRERTGANVALQWKPTADLEFFFDGLFTRYQNDFDTDFFVGLPKAGLISAATAQPDSAGPETSRGVAATITTRDNFTIASKQVFTQKTDNYQANVGTRWRTGIATLSTELTYNKSDVASQQFVLDTSYVVPRIDYNFNVGGTPNVNLNGFAYRDPANLTLLALFDNRNIAESEQVAWRGDVNLDIGEEGFFRNLKVGARYTNRTGTSGATNPANRPLPARQLTSFPDAGANAPEGIVGGRVGVDGFALPSGEWLRGNIEQLRGLAGFPAGGQPLQTEQSFNLDEETYAFYGQVGYGFDLGAVPVSGVFGARVVNTVVGLESFRTGAGGTPESVNGRNNSVNVLPSFTLKAQLSNDIVLRLVGSKSLQRPQFAQLNPVVSLSRVGSTGDSRYFYTGGGGNSDLASVTSDNVDATFEWYFSRAGSLTVGGFYKKLKGYIQNYAADEIIQENGVGRRSLITRPRNAGSGELKGVEVGYQQFFDFLPGPLSGFGAQANFTLADGEIDSPPDAAGVTTRQAIVATSKYSYNLVGIYEKYGVTARLAYNWRDKYTDSYSSAFPGGQVVVEPLEFLDFSASYDVTPNVTVTIDATNLLNTTYQDSFGTSGFTPRDTRQYDRTFGGGVRFRF